MERAPAAGPPPVGARSAGAGPAADRAPSRGWVRVARWTVTAGVPVAAAIIAYRHGHLLVDAVGLVVGAHPAWLAVGLAAIAGVYLCRAFVYGQPLRLLDYTVPSSFLWKTAIMATSLHQLIPTGGASGYAFLTYALHRRGVRAGEASLVALVDTLTYAAALGTLTVAGLVYVVATGLVGVDSVAVSLLPGLAALAAAAALYHAQRDARRLERVVLGGGRWLGGRLRTGWPERPVRDFLAAYAESKATLAREPRVFLRMVGVQYLAAGCDAAALFAAFLALGVSPPVWVVGMALILAMAGASVVGAPGGGGSFEVIMAAVLAAHGVDPAQSVGATLLYRLMAFWVPVPLTLLLWLDIRRPRAEIRKARPVVVCRCVAWRGVQSASPLVMPGSPSRHRGQDD